MRTINSDVTGPTMMLRQVDLPEDSELYIMGGSIRLDESSSGSDSEPEATEPSIVAP